MTTVLDENDVVIAVCEFLEHQGYAITESADTNSHGDDIVAYKKSDPTMILIVEAKGGTSSKSTTKRFGLPFTRGQVNTHVSVALLRGATFYSQRIGNSRFALALPANQDHVEVVKQIQDALSALNIGVFWVHRRDEVTLEAPWQL